MATGVAKQIPQMDTSIPMVIWLLFLILACYGFQLADDGPCENGQIKLKNGYRGLLEVCVGNEWGPVCDLPEDPFTSLDQQVACFQLGYSGDGVNSNKTTCGHTAWTYHITCDGTEERLLDCAHPDVTSPPPRTCTKFENVYLMCPNESQVRLNPPHDDDCMKSYEGFLQHYYNGTWNTVCHKGNWSNVESGVVCRQLGLSGGALKDITKKSDALDTTYYLLMNLSCKGNEKMIKDCDTNVPWKVTTGVCTPPHYKRYIYCEGPQLSVRDAKTTANSVTLSWSPPPNLFKYNQVVSRFCVRPWKIDANDASESMKEKCVSSKVFSYKYETLSPDTKYNVSVYAKMYDELKEIVGPVTNKTVTTNPVLTTSDIVGISVGAVGVLAILLIIVASIATLLYRWHHRIRPGGAGIQNGAAAANGDNDNNPNDNEMQPLLNNNDDGNNQHQDLEHSGVYYDAINIRVDVQDRNNGGVNQEENA